MGAESGGKPPSNWNDYRKPPPPPDGPPYRRLIAIGITIAIGIGLWLLSQPTRYSTGVGQTLTLSLPGGSRVILNTNTTITFKPDPSTPRIDLQKGEILCDLVENPSRHLSVYVNGNRITDTGTNFSVKWTKTGAIVVVRAGTVRLSGARRPESELVQNQEADVESDDAVIIKLSAEEVRRKLMWQYGRLEFQLDRLPNAVKELNRYSKVQIQIADPDIANLKVSGSVNLSDPINAFKQLTPGLGWQIEQNADGEAVWMVRKAR